MKPGHNSCCALTSQNKGLQHDVNVLLFSDHGMTDISWTDKVIELKNYINMSDTIQMKDRGPVVSLWPVPEKHTEVCEACWCWSFLFHVSLILTTLVSLV